MKLTASPEQVFDSKFISLLILLGGIFAQDSLHLIELQIVLNEFDVGLAPEEMIKILVSVLVKSFIGFEHVSAFLHAQIFSPQHALRLNQAPQ